MAKELSRNKTIIAGIAFMLTGLAITALAAGLIPMSDDKFHTTRWVVACVGISFSLSGLALSVPQKFVRFISFIGAANITSFAAIPIWVAFGPGKRVFSSSLSIGLFNSRFAPGELFGRIVFGIGGVMIGLFAVWAWVRTVKLFWGKR